MSEHMESNFNQENVESQDSNKPREKIDFNRYGKAIGKRAPHFMHRVGEIVKSHASIKYTDWRLVPGHQKDEIWNGILKEFEVPTYIKIHLQGSMASVFRKHKNTLRKNFLDKCPNIEAQKLNIPPRTKKEDWEQFCENECGEKIKERRVKNAENKKRSRCFHTGGRKSAAMVEDEMIRKQADPTIPISRTAVWIETHTRKEHDEVESGKSPDDDEDVDEHIDIEEDVDIEGDKDLTKGLKNVEGNEIGEIQIPVDYVFETEGAELAAPVDQAESGAGSSQEAVSEATMTRLITEQDMPHETPNVPPDSGQMGTTAAAPLTSVAFSLSSIMAPLDVRTMEGSSSMISAPRSPGVPVVITPSLAREEASVEEATPDLSAMNQSIVETYTNAFFTSLKTLVQIAIEKRQSFSSVRSTVSFAIGAIRNIGDMDRVTFLEHVLDELEEPVESYQNLTRGNIQSQVDAECEVLARELEEHQVALDKAIIDFSTRFAEMDANIAEITSSVVRHKVVAVVKENEAAEDQARLQELEAEVARLREAIKVAKKQEEEELTLHQVASSRLDDLVRQQNAFIEVHSADIERQVKAMQPLQPEVRRELARKRVVGFWEERAEALKKLIMDLSTQS